MLIKFLGLIEIFVNNYFLDFLNTRNPGSTVGPNVYRKYTFLTGGRVGGRCWSTAEAQQKTGWKNFDWAWGDDAGGGEVQEVAPPSRVEMAGARLGGHLKSHVFYNGNRRPRETENFVIAG